VTFNDLSREQTRIARDAVDMVVLLTKGGEERRNEITKIAFRLADQIEHSATALANLTLIEMAETARKTG
jgi:hypothetical protein